MNTIKSLLLLTLVCLFATAGFISCDVNNSNSSSGTLKVKMTDAPANYDAVYIDVQAIRFHQNSDIETDNDESNQEAEENGWVTIDYDGDPVDLLTLRNGNTITLGETELDAAHYSQMRLILGDSNKVVIDGSTYALTTPSAQQSGLKLNIDTDITEGDTYTLLVDFDASRSIVTTGSGKYILKPVLRAVDLSETGSISGVVQPSDFQTSVMAIMAEDTLSTLTDEDGAFSIQGAAEGTYDVVFAPTNDQYADSTQTDVSVSPGEDTDLGTVTLQQAPQ